MTNFWVLPSKRSCLKFHKVFYDDNFYRKDPLNFDGMSAFCCKLNAVKFFDDFVIEFYPEKLSLELG